MTHPDAASRILLEHSISTIDRVIDELAELWRRHPWISELDRMAAQTAIVELATNIVRYALPSTPDPAVMHLSIEDGALHADLVDHGPEFVGALHGRSMPDIHAESGRGLGVIAALTHDFSYARTIDGNHWMLVRRLTPSGPLS